MSLRERCVQDLVLALSTHVHNKVATVNVFLTINSYVLDKFYFCRISFALAFSICFHFRYYTDYSRIEDVRKERNISKTFIIEDDNELLN